ncbi:MAG TPA: glycosyltransferase family 2 protein [Candidatus Acidoferrum sp.]|nr:glycosyltransferase family 2 protein [Candidatus Acidoferrum sp.]
MTRPSVSAIVVSYNVRDQLLETLGAYYSTCGQQAEVVVVDNASSDGSAEAVAAAFPQAALIRLDQNLGFGRANNAGLERCHGELILTLNPDVLVQEGCVAALADFLAANAQAGAAGPRLDRPDGKLDLAARRGFPSPLSAFYRLSGLSRMFPKSPRFNRYNLGDVSLESVHEIDAGTAACLMVRRKAIDQVGFFDPQFFMYGEDLDLCYRLRQGGWKIYYVPDAVAIHLKGSSTRQATGPMLYEFHRAMWLFHRKHYASSTPALGNAIVWAGIWSRWTVLRARSRITKDSRISR